MSVHQHSAIAQNSIASTLPTRRQIILDLVRSKPGISRQRIAEELDWAINSVTGRVTELLADNLLKEDGVEKLSGRPRALLKPV